MAQIKKDISDSNELSPIMLAFKGYARELEDKQDRYEKIIKISRDITIESKRTIFLLHTIDPKKNNRLIVLQDAAKRLESVCNDKFRLIANELADRDPYQYIRAYTCGLQEFVEAYTFYEYLNEQKLSDWALIQEKLSYEIGEEESIKKISCYIRPTDYILGLADVTGELMRKCVTSLGSGDINDCFETCRCLQEFYSGYHIFRCSHRDLRHKISTLRQSVLKAENTCYQLKLREGEAEKKGIMLALKTDIDFDEGFCG